MSVITSMSVLSTACSASTIQNSNPVQQSNPINFKECISQLKPQAIASGVKDEVYEKYTKDLVADHSLIEKQNYQPEFSTPIWDYLSGLVDKERIDQGKEQLKYHEQTLKKIEDTYGVPPEVVVAVWGVESNFGTNLGKYSLIQSLSTLSCEGRRQNYFKGEFFATLRILQSGDLTENQLRGSWAGAFGQTQFMPSTYEKLAVDFDGDGRRDLVSNKADALASTANYLKQAGWQKGLPWGFEVNVPSNFIFDNESRRNKKPLSEWFTRGVTRAKGGSLIQGNLSNSTPAGLFMPAGKEGPKFLVFSNFDAIYRYNAAESYALAIAYLSDQISGGYKIVAAWPTDDPGVSRNERIEIQRYLISKGYDIGAADGLLGVKTREAISKEQEKMGLKVTGHAGQIFLNKIRSLNK